MSFEQIVIATIIGTIGAVVATGLGIWASRKWGLPGLAREVDKEKSDLIETLKGQVDAAERNAKAAVDRAIAAERLAKETEAKRQACEAEIGQVKRDLRDTEAELLALYRQTGKRTPRSLVDRHADRETAAREEA